MKLVTITLFIILNIFITSCSGDKGGLAPSKDTETSAPATVEVSNDSHIKYAETITTINNWEATLDTTDPVENLTTANLWQIEVTYE